MGTSPASPRRARWALLLLLSLATQQCTQAIKLKMKPGQPECMSKHLDVYEPFYGSFVAMPDPYGYQPLVTLIITSPSGNRVHEINGAREDRFHLVPYESGDYKFCLNQVESGRHHYRAGSEAVVVWDLFIGSADNDKDHAQEQDTHTLWHYVHMVDAQLQQLRSTMSYLYWRERRHRQTVESTNKRVLWYALLRACALVGVSVAQVCGICYLFRPK